MGIDSSLILLFVLIVIAIVLCLILALRIPNRKTDPILRYLLYLSRPLGLFFLYSDAQKDRAQKQISDRIKSGELRRCPHCAEIIQGAAKVCRYCGRNVTPVLPTS